MIRPPAILAALLALAASPGAARADCPALTVVVDNDLPGSGYSEVKPENWASHDVNACRGTYRYLTSYQGDGTRKGKAVWRPAVARQGWWAVRASFRATINRSDDADYFIYGDDGRVAHRSVNQKTTADCTHEDLGEVWCVPGGSCRLELDGDDGKSDCADAATFTLLRCDGAAEPGRCDAIAARAGYEVCAQTATTCAGTFSDGSGCAAYCAAAGMACTARFGGEPGCQKEASSVLGCADQNAHLSDWCECEGPPLAPPDAGAPALDAALTEPPDAEAAGLADAGDAAEPPDAQAVADDAQLPAPVDAAVHTDGAQPQADAGPPEWVAAGCGCAAAEGAGTGGALVGLVALALARGRRGFSGRSV